MRQIDNEFKYKGVYFKIIKRGEKAIMLEAKADFYDCDSVEVWQIRHSKESIIKDQVIEAGERKPSNDDYPNVAHQFMSKFYENGVEGMKAVAEKRFQEYETGVRPKQIIEI